MGRTLAMLCAEMHLQDAFGLSHSGGYRAYLVRLWQDGPQSDWRASAQSAQTGDTVRFADVDALFAFLLKQTQLDDRTDAEDAT